MAYWNQTELNAALSADVPATKSTIISVMQAAGLYPSGAQKIVGEEITQGGLKGEPVLAPGVPTSIVIDTNTTSTLSEIAVNQASPIVVATATGKDRVHIQSSDATVVSGSTSANEQRFYFEGSATSGTFYAGAGNDIVYGGAPGVAPNVPITVIGGTGASRIFADGDIQASAGGSAIRTGQTATSHDTVMGMGGNDTITAQNGFNTITTGDGADRVYLYGGTNTASLDGASGDIAVIDGGVNHVTISAGDRALVFNGSSTIDASAGGAIKVYGGAVSVSQGTSGQVDLEGGFLTVGSGYVYVADQSGGGPSNDISMSTARAYFGTSTTDATVSSGGASIVYTEAGSGSYAFNLSGTDSIFVGAGGGVDTVTLTGNGGHGDLVKATDHTAAQIAGTSVDGAGYTTITFSNSGQTLVVKGVDITYSDGSKIAY